ncbi:unnamed protein product [Triticum turgidum subsp. durum]|uniref:Uncharacterized protein n=1 Tax=Triticum turgidum subsp. durum TaxID=4567 RepID=A0A9R0XYR0_TRITD|nr:unnamed protein product [Triticum turgidum subsp. durum]
MGSSRVDGSGTRSFRRDTWGLQTCRSRQLFYASGIKVLVVLSNFEDDGSGTRYVDVQVVSRGGKQRQQQASQSTGAVACRRRGWPEMQQQKQNSSSSEEAGGDWSRSGAGKGRRHGRTPRVAEGTSEHGAMHGAATGPGT